MTNTIYQAMILAFIIIFGITANKACSMDNHPVEEDVDILLIANSPNTDYIVTVYTISGGGAAGYVYERVSIRKKEDRFDKNKGMIFQGAKIKNLSVEWKGDRLLQVKYTKAGDIFTQEKEWGKKEKILIEYLLGG